MQLGQLKLFDTPSFQLDAEAFKYDDSRNVPEALSIRATAFMVTFGNLQPSQTDKLIPDFYAPLASDSSCTGDF